jgi:putative RNA 2'-phosphotransferase
MKSDRLTSLSKFLSFVLRHEPQAIKLVLDHSGWAEIDELIDKCQRHGKNISREVLEEIVAKSPKRRFAISDDGRRIRANQGHSIEVDLGYEKTQPPELLFHGTGNESLALIRAEGLKKMQRHHVHLSADEATARTVAARRRAPLVLRIASRRMHDAGLVFYLSANGVWLTEQVPPEYIVFPGE